METRLEKKIKEETDNVVAQITSVLAPLEQRVEKIEGRLSY